MKPWQPISIVTAQGAGYRRNGIDRQVMGGDEPRWFLDQRVPGRPDQGTSRARRAARQSLRHLRADSPRPDGMAGPGVLTGADASGCWSESSASSGNHGYPGSNSMVRTTKGPGLRIKPSAPARIALSSQAAPSSCAGSRLARCRTLGIGPRSLCLIPMPPSRLSMLHTLVARKNSPLIDRAHLDWLKRFASV